MPYDFKQPLSHPLQDAAKARYFPQRTASASARAPGKPDPVYVTWGYLLYCVGFPASVAIMGLAIGWAFVTIARWL